MLTLATFLEAECHIRHRFHHFPIATTTSLTRHIHSPETFYKKSNSNHTWTTPPPTITVNLRTRQYIYTRTRVRAAWFFKVFLCFPAYQGPIFLKKRGTTLDSCLLFTAILLPLPPHSCHSPQHFSLTAITDDKHITTKQQKRACQKFFLTRP